MIKAEKNHKSHVIEILTSSFDDNQSVRVMRVVLRHCQVEHLGPERFASQIDYRNTHLNWWTVS